MRNTSLLVIAVAALAAAACGDTTEPDAKASESPVPSTAAPDPVDALMSRALDFEAAMKAGDTATVAGFIAGPNCAGADRAGYLAAFGNRELLAAQTVNMRLDTVQVDGTTGVTRYSGLPPESDEYDWHLLGALWVIDC